MILRPEPEIAEEFSLNRDILCYVDENQRPDNRSFQTIEKLLASDKSRLVDDVVFFVSDSDLTDSVCKDYMERSGRKVITFSWRDVEAGHEDFAHEIVRQFLYSRDFFDVRDPVSTDAQFFARYKLVDDLFDSLKMGQNSGIFGLRKIGKTSVLERLLKRNDTANAFRVALLDAQAPEIMKNDAAGVALEICREFNNSWARQNNRPLRNDIPQTANLIEASRYLREFINQLVGQGKPLLLVIDELERVLPSQSRLANPWNTEYLDLWRLLRSISQTMNQKFVFLVASTNPYFVESAKFEGEDNPLYRFLRTIYLPMFGTNDLSDMLRKLGKPMGISFSDDAIEAIYDEYGGHPFLSRQLCSAIARDLLDRPLLVESRHVNKTIEHFRAYSREDLDAVLKVFSDFYPDEYELLKILNDDERRAIKRLEDQPIAAKHLLGYGLLEKTRNSYRFTMAALPPYLETRDAREYRKPQLPDVCDTRHAVIQGYMNQIEPALRNLVMVQMRASYGPVWQDELMKHMQAGAVAKIETMGSLTPTAFMEETYVSDLVQVINGNWKQFSNFFTKREEFRVQAKALTDLARPMSDHRKKSMCQDDAAYMRAHDACLWFRDAII